MSGRFVLLFLTFTTTMTVSLRAQDLIVRIYGDTIHCRVDQEDQHFVYYRTTPSRRGVSKIISIKEVREIFYDVNTNRKKVGLRKTERLYEKIQITMQAGYSHILVIDDMYGDKLEELYDELRGGTYLDARGNYFLNADVGVGFLYSHSRFRTKTEISVKLSAPPALEFNGGLLHNRYVNYYAVNLAYRMQSDASKTVFQIDAGLGILTFEDRGKLIDEFQLTSFALGGHLSGSFQLGLGEGLYLPAYVSLKGFSLSSFKLNTDPDIDPDLREIMEGIYFNLGRGISMSRLDVGIGLGFAF